MLLYLQPFCVSIAIHGVRNAVQVSYCAQLNAASDKATTCQEQLQAQNSCRRSCGLCYERVDSSSLVWYNQAKSQGSSAALTPTPAHSHVDPRGSFPNRAHSQAQASSGLQEAASDDLLNNMSNLLADEPSRQVDAQAQANDDDLLHVLGNPLAHDVADAISSQHVGSSADSLIMQPASTGMATDDTQAVLSPSTVHDSLADVAGGLETDESNVYTLEQLNRSSNDSKLPHAAALSTPINGKDHSRHNGLTNQGTWQNHLSNPFCMSVLCLCVLLMTCIVGLLRNKFRRRKVLR